MNFSEFAVQNVIEQLKKDGKTTVSKYAYEGLHELDRRIWKRCLTPRTYTKDELYEPSDRFVTKKTVPEILQSLKSEIQKEIEYWPKDLVAEPSPMYCGVPDNDSSDAQRYITKREKLEKRYEKLSKIEREYLLNSEHHTLADFIIEKENEKKVFGSALYKPVLMSKQKYSKIKSTENSKPDFETCVQFIFGLKLDYEESVEFMRRAGRAFSDDARDQLVACYIKNKNYNIFDLNNSFYIMDIEPIGPKN